MVEIKTLKPKSSQDGRVPRGSWHEDTLPGLFLWGMAGPQDREGQGVT
jgi:hypothetical protein